jgi:hypothetical protein
MFKKRFYELFCDIDMPVALAPLIPGRERRADEEGHQPEHDERRAHNSESWKNLGPLCQSAIVLCKDERFQRYVAHKTDVPIMSVSEEEATSYLYQQCDISTRKELDTKDGAYERFGDMMADYRKWQS